MELSKIIEAVGREVRSIRNERGLSQAEASRRAKIDSQTWSRLERGAPQNFTLETLNAISQALQIEFIDLFRRLQPSSPDDLADDFRSLMTALDDEARATLLFVLQRLTKAD